MQTRDTKVTLLSTSGAGVYYIVVPVGVKLEVYNGATLIKKTKDAGLKAGKYYTLLTGETTGSAKNSLGEDIDWVQLWAGGPKFAVKNVKEDMTWTDAIKTGDEYVWGANWRTPKFDEVFGEGKLYFTDDKETSLPTSVAGSPSFELKEQNGYLTVVFTGVQPGYTKNTLTLYDKPNTKEENHNFDFWIASDEIVEGEDKGVLFQIQAAKWDKLYIYSFGKNTAHWKDKKFFVRPVLAK